MPSRVLAEGTNLREASAVETPLSFQTMVSR